MTIVCFVCMFFVAVGPLKSDNWSITTDWDSSNYPPIHLCNVVLLCSRLGHIESISSVSHKDFPKILFYARNIAQNDEYKGCSFYRSS